jgi:hypothetical protein
MPQSVARRNRHWVDWGAELPLALDGVASDNPFRLYRECAGGQAWRKQDRDGGRRTPDTTGLNQAATGRYGDWFLICWMARGLLLSRRVRLSGETLRRIAEARGLGWL